MRQAMGYAILATIFAIPGIGFYLEHHNILAVFLLYAFCVLLGGVIYLAVWLIDG